PEAAAWVGALPAGDGPALAADGDALATLGRRYARWALSETLLPHRVAAPAGITSLAWSPAGVLAAGTRGALLIVGRDGEVEAVALPSCLPVKDVAWLDDRVAVACGGEEVDRFALLAGGAVVESDRGGPGPRLA